jgi:tRNA pseudouridine38-40 synthase
MVGTLVEVGHGAIAAERMATIRGLKKRAAAGPTAPAKGLTLVHVELLDGPRDDEPA